MDYRMDRRSEQEFKDHLKKCTILETKLMTAYVGWLNGRTENKNQYTYEHHGVDNTGEFIADAKNVTSKSDFILIKNKTDRRPIEIKHCGPERDIFHLKTGHVKSCIKNNVCIVNFMGVNGTSPKFCIIPPSILAEYQKSHAPVLFWNKPCIKFNCKDFIWHSIGI